MESQYAEGTMAWLIDMYVEDARPLNPIVGSRIYTMRAIQKTELGAKMAATIKPSDFIDYARKRLGEGVTPQTVQHDLTCLRGPLKDAALAWNMPEISTDALDKALKGYLRQRGLVGKGRPRDIRPTENDLARLIAYFHS
jgi:hypothetical protein